MFDKRILNFQENPFDTLSKSLVFEDITKGRKGGVLVSSKTDKKTGTTTVPIVRTTTPYQLPSTGFKEIHHKLIEKIVNEYKKHYHNIRFNNAMIELYTEQYRKMGYHTDQAQDFEEDSYICLFSCYMDEYADEKSFRRLVVDNKTTKERQTIILEPNSVVLFSTETNKNNIHKIILEGAHTNTWLGITMRLSKTIINFIDKKPFFTDGRELRLASEEEKLELRKHKSSENKQIGYEYPDLDYTISPSDLMLPV